MWVEIHENFRILRIYVTLGLEMSWLFAFTLFFKSNIIEGDSFEIISFQETIKVKATGSYQNLKNFA